MNSTLCDYGLTKAMNALEINIRNNTMGTTRYMAAELFELHDGKDMDKADIWTLGCVIAELFAEKWPNQECSTTHQVMTKLVVKKQPPFLDLSSVSDALLPIVNACFDFNPDSRASA